MRTALRIALWNVAFLVCIAALTAAAAANGMDAVAFGLPGLLAAWTLVQGAVFAQQRRWVVVCAVASGMLLVVQVALLTFFVWWNRGFGNTQQATQSLVFIIWVALGGALFIGWFWRAKRKVGA